MPFNDHDYHVRRECEYRVQAEAAATEQARMIHLAIAEQHGARTSMKGSSQAVPASQQLTRA